MKEYSATNCASRFVLREKSTGDLILSTTDINEIDKIFNTTSHEFIHVGKKLVLEETNRIIESISCQYYKSILDGAIYEDIQTGEISDFNVDIIIHLSSF